MNLGDFYPCLNVRDLAASIDFYLKLDFRIVEDHRVDNWAVLQHNNMALCLFQGHIEQNLINFRGGDIEAIQEEAEGKGLVFSKRAHVEGDGSWSAEILDPDGNCIYLNTFPSEREQFLRKGKLIDT